MLLMTAWFLTLSATPHYLFTPIADPQGDSRIRSILQLPDGRIVCVTEGGVEIYDGAGFSVWPSPAEKPYPLHKYDGHMHLYLSTGKHQLLWIKNYFRIQCFDLETCRYINNVDSLFRSHGVNGKIDDFFTVADGGVMVTTEGRIVHPATEFSYTLTASEGRLLDVASAGTRLYLFYESGTMETVDTESGKRITSSRPYPETERERFKSTSLVVTAPRGFYQLRNGSRGGFFRYSLATGNGKSCLRPTLHSTR